MSNNKLVLQTLKAARNYIELMENLAEVMNVINCPSAKKQWQELEVKLLASLELSEPKHGYPQYKI
jgi:hypothetical protein